MLKEDPSEASTCAASLTLHTLQSWCCFYCSRNQQNHSISSLKDFSPFGWRDSKWFGPKLISTSHLKTYKIQILSLNVSIWVKHSCLSFVVVPRSNIAAVTTACVCDIRLFLLLLFQAGADFGVSFLVIISAEHEPNVPDPNIIDHVGKWKPALLRRPPVGILC